ncbi:sugar ABC transport system, permease protein [Fimbriimonas ginsengisoli Gsoil 348]|uniref:Sugar ABC transport system, permease protein n=2 Tax=Fimbriimonas ginsengisoli TaxID=1005039 RepID=A0A068NUD7_FIMGI|nr:sugar ABC transport system, permease protein [Fimbriimonas ginsengisoli Gsoil 348]
MTYTRRRGLAGLLFLAPYALSFGVFIVLPILVALVLAFMQFDLTARDSIKFVGTKNFVDAWKDDYFWQAMRATLAYVVLMVPSLLVTALGMALGLNAMTRGRNTVRALLFLPGMLNVAVTGILWQWFYNGEFGLFNFLLKSFHLNPAPWLSDKAYAMPSIVLMSLWWTLGGTSVVLLAALQQIPRQLFEAAVLDGSGPRALFGKIILPLLKPVLLFVVVTNTIAGFQVFGQPFLLTRGGPELSTRGLVQYIYETAFNNYRLGYGAAMSWMLFAVVAIFALIQYGFLRRSTA